MKFSILIPHYKTGKMTAYAIHQLLKHKGRHEIDIHVVNNSPGHDSIEYLFPYSIFRYDYPSNKLQSHGIAFDYILPEIETEYFIAIESDSFPTSDNWLDYYECLIKQGYDAAGSLLQLSGGQYLHPAGALYRKSVWQEAKSYCTHMIDYAYLPNIAMKENHACHLMVKNSLFGEFCKKPEKYVELHSSYKDNSPLQISEKALSYQSVISPFHNGTGRFQESFSTYRFRNPTIGLSDVILDNETDLIYRLGYEPGQWLHYFMLAMGNKIFYIPTETKWMPNRENQQQEYTKNEAGFIHLWGVSAYDNCSNGDVQDIVLFKKNQVERLYASIKNPGSAGVY